MSLHIDGLSCEDNPTQLRAMEDFLALKLPKFIFPWGSGGAIRPALYLYLGQRRDTWNPPG